MHKREIDTKNQEILNVLQSCFPLATQPWICIAKMLNITQEEVIQRVAHLKRTNVVREISAIFDTRKLGYKSTLVAMRIPDHQLHASAMMLNLHPGISHNYARNSYFNIWFTLAIPPKYDINTEVDKLKKATNAQKTRVMPTIRFFKIGVNFDMKKKVTDSNTTTTPTENGSALTEISATDVKMVKLLQEDIQLVENPFEEAITSMGMSQREFFEYINGMLHRKIMRRYGAVLHHRRAGFSANAMVVWNVPDADITTAGQIMARFPQVTHCYQRPRYPDWRFCLFTMIHAVSKVECESVAHKIAQSIGFNDKLLLYSTREYKKTRVRYFVDDNSELNPDA